MAKQGIFTGGVQIRNLNGYLIAVNGEVFATTNTGGTTNAFFYQAKRNITSGDPGSGHLIWNNATQTSATQLNVSHLTDTPIEDIDLFLSAIVSGNKLVVQDRNDSGSYQSWTVSGTPTQIGSSYWTIPVTLLESQGTGTTGFSNNHDLLFAIITGGTGGGGITTNSITFNNSGSGAASGTSFNGGTAVTISYNSIGAQPSSSVLSGLASLTYASGTPFVKMTGAGTFALDTNTYLTANQTITLSGDVTGSGSTTISTTIGNNSVTLAKFQQISTASFLGRVTAATGNVEVLSGTQATTLLDTFTTTLKGLVPAPGTPGNTKFLREDGTWVVPSGGGGGTPAGSNTQIQYNNSGAFGASANLVWNGSGVGIFNSSPFYALSVGDGTSTRQVVINGLNSGTAGGSSIAVQANSLTTIMFGNKSNVIGGAYDGQPLFGYGGSTNSLQFYNFNTLAVTAMISSGDRFLIGTTTDNNTDKLQVNGSAIATTLKVNTSGQTSTISNKYQAGTSGFNIFIGNGGGSLSGTSGDQSSYNVSLGHGALAALTTGLYNFAIGAGALGATNTGYENVAIGKDALALNTSGYDNTAIGTPAMVFNTTGYKNTAIGYNSFLGNLTGYSNIAIGVLAGTYISGGSNNQTASQSIYIGEDTRASTAGNINEIVIGHNAIGQGSNSVTLGNSSITKTFLRGRVMVNTTTDNGTDNLQVNGSAIATTLKVNTSGQTITISSYSVGGTGDNIWIGNGGTSSTSTSTGNVSLGVDALLNNTSGGANVAIGGGALKANTTGVYNFAIGTGALQTNTTGNYNTAIGVSSLAYTTGSDNTAIGSNSMALNETGSSNVAIGTQALFFKLTGNSNIAIGYDAGRRFGGGSNLTSSSQLILIGEDTRPSANGNTNEIVIGHAAIGQGSNTVTLGNSSITKTFLRGSTMVNTTTDNGVDKLQVNGNIYSSGTIKSGTTTTNGLEILTGAGKGIIMNTTTTGSQDQMRLTFQQNGTDKAMWYYSDFANICFMGTITQEDMVFASNNSNALTIKGATQNVVISNTGTDNGTDKLQVNGSAIATALKIIGGTNSQVLYADGSTKQITSGTAAPTGGSDGDIYLQYV